MSFISESTMKGTELRLIFHQKLNLNQDLISHKFKNLNISLIYENEYFDIMVLLIKILMYGQKHLKRINSKD